MPFKSSAQRRAMYAATEGKSNIGIPQSVGEKFVRHDSDTADCAGILFQCGGRFLLVKRSDTGEWEQPGGHLKSGESVEDGALRECLEEIGPIPKGVRRIVGENEIDGGTYTVLLQQVQNEFKPTLNGEHTEFVWANPEDLPEPMLPPVAEIIDSLKQIRADSEWEESKHPRDEEGKFSTLYHGSHEKINEIKREGVFNGIFGSPSKSSALSHGPNLHKISIPKEKILTQESLSNDVPYEKQINALKEAMPWLDEEDLETAYKAVIEDEEQEIDDDDMERIFLSDDRGENSWRAQKARGEVAKELGYSAVEMDDEHGTSYLILSGNKIEPITERADSQKKKKYQTELDIAKAIRDGKLPSPQQYENLWLFDIRITGTGTSYRDSLDEYVYRPPENFLTEEFVQRCNGLPLIFEHPETAILDSNEYRERSIGSVFLPYIRDDEVRGIVKVFDEDGAMLMQNSHASTSPAVVFRNAGSTETIEIDGDTVLIEGKPSLLDHLAICEVGVWDKGKAPDGVTLTDSEVPEMDKEELRGMMRELLSELIAETKADTEVVEKPAMMDATEEQVAEEEETKGMEAAEEGLEEAEEAHLSEPENKEELEKDKALEYADSLKKENAELRSMIKAMDTKISNLNKPLSSADRDALSQAQARADSVAQMFGDEVAAPLHGENPIAYRKRLADKFKKHSPKLKDVKLDSMDPASFTVIEDQIYADATKAALSPASLPAGKLIPLTRKDSAGRTITTFTGDPLATWGPFMSPGTVCKIDKTLGKGVH